MTEVTREELSAHQTLSRLTGELTVTQVRSAAAWLQVVTEDCGKYSVAINPDTKVIDYQVTQGKSWVTKQRAAIQQIEDGVWRLFGPQWRTIFSRDGAILYQGEPYRPRTQALENTRKKTRGAKPQGEGGIRKVRRQR